MQNPSLPIAVFGAFDRHNIGDLLFAHVVEALLPPSGLQFTGLALRDLRRHGGHLLQALPYLATQCGPLNVIHAGGELLTCSAVQATVMLLSASQALPMAQWSAAHLQQAQHWARQMLGVPDLAPYLVNPASLASGSKVVCNALGGVELDRCPAPMRDEVLQKLSNASFVGIRDEYTLAMLRRHGIDAQLQPDPAVMVAELFSEDIGNAAVSDAIARIVAGYPDGYVAVQFSTEFDDDATLDTIAAQLDRIGADTGLGIVLFRAGAAPWHDDLALYQRLRDRLTTSATICTSLDLWQICALIAGSRGYIGSSLHGRIVALAFALPRVSVRAPASGVCITKHDAFAATWESADMPGAVPAAQLAHAFASALASNAAQRQRKAAELAGLFRNGFDQLRRALR